MIHELVLPVGTGMTSCSAAACAAAELERAAVSLELMRPVGEGDGPSLSQPLSRQRLAERGRDLASALGRFKSSEQVEPSALSHLRALFSCECERFLLKLIHRSCRIVHVLGHEPQVRDEMLHPCSLRRQLIRMRWA